MEATKPKTFPYNIENLDPEINEKISKQFSDGLPKLVQVGPQKMIIPDLYRDHAEEYYTFQLRPSDVIIMGYPRSGTTLIQEMAWLLINNLDFAKAQKSSSFISRVPFLEFKSVTTEQTIAATSLDAKKFAQLDAHMASLETLANSTERRIFKTHLHLSFLPPNILECGCKLIYIARDPKDLAVSFYHLQRNSLGRNFTENFETFLNLFIANQTLLAPYWTHLREVWEHRNNPNVRFLFYENVIQDLESHVEDIAKFLDVEVSKEQIDQLVNVLSFEQFKKYITSTDATLNNKKNVNDDFIRRGKIGDWEKYFTDKMKERVNIWIQENLIETGIVFPRFSHTP